MPGCQWVYKSALSWGKIHYMILIAIGANLPAGDGALPLTTCEEAVRAVCTIPGMTLVAQSTWYRSQAIPVSSQPDYCNGVIRMAGGIEPHRLLQALQAIEARFGRVRSVPNAARTLDLDIIDIDGLLHATPDLLLPHPRAHERAFVLYPLTDVAPDWRHPTLDQSAAALLAGLPPQKIKPWHDTAAW